MSLVSARRTHQGPRGRRRRVRLEQLRVTGLLNFKHRESSDFVLGQQLGVLTDHLGPSLLHRCQLRVGVCCSWDSITLARQYPCVAGAYGFAFALFEHGSRFWWRNCCCRFSIRRKLHFVQFNNAPAAALAAQLMSAGKNRVK